METILQIDHGNQEPKRILEWKNLKVKATSRVILNDVSGYVCRGEIMAIIGPSGMLTFLEETIL